MGAQEWQDTLFLRYSLDTPDLPYYYNGCNTTFYTFHALDCKRGGLVRAHHNNLHDGVADLAGKAFTPSHVRNDRLIFVGCATNSPKATPARSKSKTAPVDMSHIEAMEQKGDLLIRDLFQNGTESVHIMRVVNTDAKYHSEKTLEKCLQESKQAKKKMYL